MVLTTEIREVVRLANLVQRSTTPTSGEEVVDLLGWSGAAPMNTFVFDHDLASTT